MSSKPKACSPSGNTLVLEGIGDGKVRVNSASLDHSSTILPTKPSKSWRSRKSSSRPGLCEAREWLNHDPTGWSSRATGRGSGDSVTCPTLLTVTASRSGRSGHGTARLHCHDRWQGECETCERRARSG
jgi:hypothetical protein